MKAGTRNRQLFLYVCQCLLGGVFIFSGIVKCIDPAGTAIKLTDYFQVFGWTWIQSWAMPLAVCLCLTEFLIGIHVFFGRNRKVFLPACALFVFVFTCLTLYIAIENPISDCGCFGDAVVLDNWTTFYKNLVLCLLTGILLYNMRRAEPLWSKSISASAFNWYAGYVLLFGSFLCWQGLYHLPLLDFRPFKSGVNIPEAMGMAGSDNMTEEYYVIYEKDGIRQEFSLEALPDEDSGWEFVEQKIRPVSGAGERILPENSIHDFFITDEDNGDITYSLLEESSYLFLLISPSLNKFGEEDLNRVRSLSDYTAEYGYPFYLLTVNEPGQRWRWREEMAMEVPMVYSDATILKTIVRADPALLLLKDGTIYWKKNWRDAEVEELLSSGMLENQTYGQKVIINEKMRISFLLVLLFAPIALLLLYKRYKLSIKTN